VSKSKKILIAPLDWGLGHATRCIPIIRELIIMGCEVIVAGNNNTNTLIEKEFPELQYIYLKGYEISYSLKKWQLPWVILKQLPKILAAIQSEHKWLNSIIQQYNIDVIISDNRYGLYSTKIPSVFITHQLQIKVPQSSILQWVVKKINTRFINKYDICWVPDYNQNPLAGELSDCNGYNNVEYIGNISRFRASLNEQVDTKYKILVLLSGPEPQRSILEDKLTKQLIPLKLKSLIIRGKPSNTDCRSLNQYIDVIDHLKATELEQVILESGIIICRSGYSTLMDLVKLNKHAALVATPGQTEQEYLVEYLSNKKWFLKSSQHNINIESIIAQFDSQCFESFPSWDFNAFKKQIETLLAKY
jgi:UDP-N-acetylglucosamine transferase subunit ALG13